MKKYRLLFVLSFALLATTLRAQDDAEGCTDYPMFNRMPGFHIGSCEMKEFDAFNFTIENSSDGDAKTETVEGKYFYYWYDHNEGVENVSALQIFRNFENALKQMNATIVGKVVESGNSYSFICAKVVRGSQEVWVRIEASGADYTMYFVERALMEQYIQAGMILEGLNKDGFFALDILFDTGKATIKEESKPLIDQVYEMLKANPSLKVSIEGHTDNVGDPQANKTLSENRAKAVVEYLIAKGIPKERLSSKGWGQEMPVADNRKEDGRAKNRRVEIVKL